MNVIRVVIIALLGLQAMPAQSSNLQALMTQGSQTASRLFSSIDRTTLAVGAACAAGFFGLRWLSSGTPTHTQESDENENTQTQETQLDPIQKGLVNALNDVAQAVDEEMERTATRIPKNGTVKPQPYLTVSRQDRKHTTTITLQLNKKLFNQVNDNSRTANMVAFQVGSNQQLSIIAGLAPEKPNAEHSKIQAEKAAADSKDSKVESKSSATASKSPAKKENGKNKTSTANTVTLD